jgi:Leucine-rich repeat (LRR) protein
VSEYLHERGAKLATLELEGNHLKAALFIKHLINLVELNLASNLLAQLPKAVGHLACLRSLNLENNALTQLPEEVRNRQGFRV